MNPVLVHVLRGQTIESLHRGAFAVLDATGAVRLAAGDIDRPVFPRSAVKLLQALPLVASGAAQQLDLSDEQLALACGSHSGEAAHTRVAAAMLARAGLDAAALECGAHPPYAADAVRALAALGRAPDALHNNCSGKHAGFLCLACRIAAGAGLTDLRAFARGYVQPGHDVMRAVADAVQQATSYDLAGAAQGTDGCSIPTFAIPLRHLALAYARVASGHGLDAGHAAAASRLRRAIAQAPFMVAGSGRFDTLVMQRLGERVCCKVGAEGVYCAALPDLGLGVAIKIDDGSTRAVEVVMAAVIEALLTLDRGDADFMQQLSQVPLSNWNGLHVGDLQPAPSLREALGCVGRPA